MTSLNLVEPTQSFHKQALLLNGAIEIIKGNSCLGTLFDRSSFIDLTITSPPYNVDMPYGSSNDNLSYEEYLEFTAQWLRNVYKWTKNTGRLCLNIPLDKNKGGQQSVGADITAVAKKIGWKYHSTIIWNEQNISRRTAWGSWLSASAPYVIAPVELIVILYKGCWKKSHAGINDIIKEEFMAWTNGVWTFNGESAKRVGHPAPFPEELPSKKSNAKTLMDFTKDILKTFEKHGINGHIEWEE